MYRPILYTQEELRSFDVLWGYKDVLNALSDLALSFIGSSVTLISGFAATPSGLAITLASGRLFYLTTTDATAYGAIAADSSLIVQVGHADSEVLTLTSAPLAVGQAYWALIQVEFQQNDYIRSGDPDSGILPYFNSSNPAQPLNGPGGAGTPQDTVRRAEAILSVKYGTPNTIGAEVPPSPDTNNVPIYLIDLVYGQSTVQQSQILIASPSLGGNVPSNYPQAPFLAGLLNQHHTGVLGQAPKVVLTNGLEVQGILPYGNLPSDLLGSVPEPANVVYAGPTSGVDATPTFRSLVQADLPLSDPEPAATVFAGPVSGPNAIPTFRALALSDLPAGLGSFKYQEFVANDTWICPAGVNLIYLTMVGGGGGGAGGASGAGGGGGGAGAGIRFYPVVVTPGYGYAIVAGNGGSGGAIGGGAGTAGGSSSFGGTITVSGGSPGSGASGGAGAAAPYLFPIGGSGAAASGTLGGAGGTSVTAAGVTEAAGAKGAGGAGGDGGVTPVVGYAGGSGYVLVVW